MLFRSQKIEQHKSVGVLIVCNFFLSSLSWRHKWRVSWFNDFIGRLSLETKPRPKSWPTLSIVWRRLKTGVPCCCVEVLRWFGVVERRQTSAWERAEFGADGVPACGGGVSTAYRGAERWTADVASCRRATENQLRRGREADTGARQRKRTSCRSVDSIHWYNSGQLSLLPSAGQEMSSSLRATVWRPSVADWGGGMSASCKPRVQLFADVGNGWYNSGQLSLLPSAGQEMSSSLRATVWRLSVADWGGGMSASCKPRVQLFADVGSGWPHSALWYH